MRRGSPRPQGRAVRFVLELRSDDEGHVAGEVTGGSRPPTAFSGWLELLRVLEDRTQTTTVEDGSVEGPRAQE
jgi:hypothetical protein